jgi:hypothetical protein
MEPVGGNHEPEATARGRSWHCTAEVFPVRACGMEARGLPQHRTQVKPRKAGLSGPACRSTRRPISNRGRTVVGTEAAGRVYPYPKRSLLVRQAVASKEATTRAQCWERSRITP